MDTESLRPEEQSPSRYSKELHFTPGAWLFFGMHLTCLLVFVTGADVTSVVMCGGFFLLRKWGITAGFHRYFSHRSFKTSRVFQFVLAFVGGMSAQKGALWWAAHHRHHHRHADTPEDVHSPEREGFYWSHVGWVLSSEFHEYDPRQVKDLSRYPELVWLDRWHFVPPLFLAVLCYLIHGWMGVLWGFVVSTVVLYHTTFAINSFCHIFGKRRYETGESSKNSLLLALVTLGEGWHNNHHHYPLSARQGFFWWEIDLTYYVLKILSWFRVVWDLQRPPARILTREAMTAVR